MIRRLRRLSAWAGRDQSGAAAVEFAMLIGPLLFLLLGILEVSTQYFITTAFDSALQRAARLVRTGQAQDQHMTVDQLKAAMCAHIYDLFDCEANSYLTVDAIDEFEVVNYALPVDAEGSFSDDIVYDVGTGSSFMMVRGYMQYSLLFDVFGALSPRLSNGNRIIVSSALFKNEPF